MLPYNTKNNKLIIGGIPADELVGEYGSPLYVYDKSIILDRYRHLIKSITYPRKRIYYAMKSNSNPAILKLLRDEGCGIDAVSAGEVMLALKLGFSPEKILFTAVSLTDEEIDFAVENRVLLNIGSLHTLWKYGRKYPGTAVSIRVNPAFGDGHHSHVNTGGPASKFGIYESDFDKANEVLNEFNLSLAGIQCHIGSGILSVESYQRLMTIILPLAEKFGGLDFVDFGGGIGVSYRPGENDFDLPAFGKTVNELMTDFDSRYGKDVDFVIEPGRFLVAESGYLLTTVNDIKSTPEYNFIGVDSGFNHLRRPMTYGSYHHILNASNMDAPKMDVVVAGYLCESGDVFTRDENGILTQSLGEPRDGDVLAILTAGAYGFSMSSNYNTQPRPAEVLVSDGNSRLVRRRETFEDILNTALF